MIFLRPLDSLSFGTVRLLASLCMLKRFKRRPGDIWGQKRSLIRIAKTETEVPSRYLVPSIADRYIQYCYINLKAV